MVRRVATFALFGLLAALPAYSSPLDGKTFVGEIAKKGETKGDPDTFSFSGGKFHSTGCDPHGFTPSRYQIGKLGEDWTFMSLCTSPKEGQMSWKGTISGDVISGTAVWKKPGQAAIEYTFTGTEKTGAPTAPTKP